MQTQCPKCDTRFRVTDTQLEAAEGQVRCSLCDEVFKAVTINEDLNSTDLEQNIELAEINTDPEETPDGASSNKESQSQETNEQEISSPPESDTEVIHADTDTSDNNNVVELGLNSDEDIISENSQSFDHSVSETIETDEELSNEFDDQLNTQENDNQNIDADTANLNKLDIDIDEQDIDKEEIYLNEQESAPEIDIEIDDDENNQKQHLDLFQDDNNQDSPQIIPDEIRHNTASNDINFGESLAWASGILLLSITLVTQYFWLNRDQYISSPKFKTLAENTCLKFDCSKISIRDPAHIELLTRNVFSHPDEKNALMINVALKNNAKFSQPYPVLQVNFSDVRGDAVVARRFTPAEYLIATDQVKNPLLQPGSSSNFSLEIEDPGKQAITYEFNFL